MNKQLRNILIFLNTLMFLLALYWFLQNREPEPIIIMIGQIAAIVGLSFENTFSRIMNKRVKKSEISIKAQAGDKVKNTDIEDSTIDIQINK